MRTGLITAFAIVCSLTGYAGAQGLISVEIGPDGKTVNAASADSSSKRILNESDTRRVTTIQRMLVRLKYLDSTAISGELDRETRDAVDSFAKDSKLNRSDPLSEDFLRTLFLAVWDKNDWTEGQADGFDLVVDTKQVREAQIALRDLGYTPGPSDGKFGPGTYTAIEIFQEERGMRVNGLLTTNIYNSIVRASSNRDLKFDGEVRVLNWTDYINPETLVQFERKTNIRVIYDVFGSLNEADTMMETARKPYDLVVRAGFQIPKMVMDNKVQSIEVGALENYSGIDPQINKITTNWDPSSSYEVPYMWGTVGIVVDRDKVKERLGEEDWSWGLILDPKNARKLADCGVIVVDVPNDVLTSMVGYVGEKKGKLDEKSVEQLREKLADVSKYVDVVDSERFIDKISKEEACVSVGYSGDAMQALAAKKTKASRLNFFIPEDGSILWFDYFLMLKDAENRKEATTFLDYILEPEVAAENTNFVQYANPVQSSKRFITEDLLNNAALYPPAAVVEQLGVVNPASASLQREIDTVWKTLSRK